MHSPPLGLWGIPYYLYFQRPTPLKMVFLVILTWMDERHGILILVFVFEFSISNTIPSSALGQLVWLYSKHPPLTPALPAHGGCFPHNSLRNISGSAFHEQRLLLPQSSRRPEVVRDVRSCSFILFDRMKATVLATFTNLWKNSQEDWWPWPHTRTQTLLKDVCCSI